MVIFVAEEGVQMLIASVEASDTIANVKAIVSSEIAVEPQFQTLCFKGEELEDGRTLSDYNILPESTLDLTLKVCKEKYILSKQNKIFLIAV